MVQVTVHAWQVEGPYERHLSRGSDGNHGLGQKGSESSGAAVTTERRDRESADIQKHREDMAKQAATSLDHAASIKRTYTDWEARLANILSSTEAAPGAVSTALAPAPHGWQVCLLL